MVSTSVSVLPLPPAHAPAIIHWSTLSVSGPPGVTPGSKPSPASFTRYRTLSTRV